MSPLTRIDAVIHQRTRLAIMAALMEVADASFTYLRDTLELSDGNLSRHLTVLENAGYVVITKDFEGRTPRTTVAATKPGRVAFADYVTALESMINTVRHPGRGSA